MEKSNLYVLIGLPGSGKSTWAGQQGRIVISSDGIREEFFGTAENQDNNAKVFEEVFRRTTNHLKLGEDVILDATNISRKRRKDLFVRFNKIADLTAIYFAVSFDTCLFQNAERKRQVPNYVLDRMYKQMEIPDWEEGWKDILILGEESQYMFKPLHLELVSEKELYDNIFFDDIYGVDQKVPQYHAYTISKHSWVAYRHIFKEHKELSMKDRNLLCYAIAFHDIGKGYCQEWNEEKGRCTFYAHDKVSAQKAMSLLYKTLPKEELIELGNLINNHILYFQNKELACQRVKRPDLLALLNEADHIAKGVTR